MAGCGEGDAFENCAVEMREPMACAQSEELRPRVAMRSKPFTGEVGHEDEAVRAGRGGSGAGRHLVIAEGLFVKGTPRPAHGVAARFEKDEGAPMALDGRDVADLGVEQRRFGDEGENAGCSRHVGGEAEAACARAQERHWIVCSADQYGGPLLQSGLARGRTRHCAQDLQRLADRRQLGGVEPEQVDHRVRPGSRAGIHKETARGVAGIHRDLAGQPKVDVVLRHEDGAAGGIGRRVIVAAATSA